MRTILVGFLAVAIGLAGIPARGDDPKPGQSKPQKSPSTVDVEALRKSLDAVDKSGGLKLAGPDLSLMSRQRRLLRWSMVFSTRTGADYAKQLDALGAILAVPDREGNYLVIRDLKERPVKAEKEDLRSIKRIFWVDDRAESVGPLAKALELKLEPAHVVAFFPESLEKELLAKEQKYRGLSEGDIAETRFRVVRRGDMHIVVVRSQRAVDE
jgi:hypothetical protein